MDPAELSEVAVDHEVSRVLLGLLPPNPRGIQVMKMNEDPSNKNLGKKFGDVHFHVSICEILLIEQDIMALHKITAEFCSNSSGISNHRAPFA